MEDVLLTLLQVIDQYSSELSRSSNRKSKTSPQPRLAYGGVRTKHNVGLSWDPGTEKDIR